jgi:hypothetical protein
MFNISRKDLCFAVSYLSERLARNFEATWFRPVSFLPAPWDDELGDLCDYQERSKFVQGQRAVI